MELKKFLKNLSNFLLKYKYLFVIFVIGLLLMTIPSGKTNSSESNTEPHYEIESVAETENKLSQILSKVAGAGEVMIMLTIEKGEEICYQTDDNIDEGETKSSSKHDTITVTDSDRNQSGLIKQIIPARYQGAVVVCNGADDPAVRLAIVDAVSKLTGLGSNKISVLKMN